MSMTNPGKKIQLVEDDREVAALIADDLANRGFDIIVCHNGHDGFVSILKNLPDLVLCDISMPVMSGLEMLKILSDLAPRIGHIPFVFMTALTDRDNELQARRLGADDYIGKPIDFEMLHTIINARLAGVARNQIWPALVKLTDREIEALTWVARGKSSAQIAEILGLTKRTIDYHLDNARDKLGVRTRTEAVVKAVFGRFIESDFS
jgi:DNA-binding NarL/FixJ family response regulator